MPISSRSAALAFVVTAPGADRVHMTPVVLSLRVNRRVSIDLAGRSLQDRNVEALRPAR